MIKDYANVQTVEVISDNFMVKSCEQGSSNANKPYLSIVLQDVSGIIDARKWDVDPGDLGVIVPGKIIGVEGAVMRYKGKLQIKIARVFPVDQAIQDRSKFVPTAPVSLAEMQKEVKALVDSIQDKDIRAVTEGVFHDNWKAYSVYPAAVTVHEAYESGLIYHCLMVCKIALAIVDLYPSVFNRDYVIAGTLMHDIGKVQELSGPIQTKYTRIGKLESHIQIGAMIVNRKCLELKIPDEKTDLLTHIILSHHGVPEYGSPVIPKTADAFLVHLADDADAKINVLIQYLGQVKPGEFTTRIPWMDGNEFYKPTGK